MSTSLIDVWTVSLTEPCEIILSDAEHARASRFIHEVSRVRWSRAHSGLRTILASYLNVHPLAMHFTTNEHGKPFTEGLEFNLSHCHDYAMIAVSLDAPVGIDIEGFRQADLGKLLQRLGETDIPSNREAQHQRWTLREAASKARGGALFDPVDPAVQTIPLVAPAGHFASLAALGATPIPRYCGGVVGNL